MSLLCNSHDQHGTSEHGVRNSMKTNWWGISGPGMYVDTGE